MKKLYFLLFFVSLQVTAQIQQIIPCEFSWQSVVLPNGTVADYTSPSNIAQPYQGPCAGFAFNRAIECQYEIAYNRPNRNLQLNNAFTDYAVWNWRENVIINRFNNSLAIPTGAANGNFGRGCHNEYGDCKFDQEIRACINAGSCFRVSSQFVQDEWVNTAECIPCEAGTEWVSTPGVTAVHHQISTVDDLKLKLINEGPLVLKVDNLVATALRPATSVRDHLFDYGYGADTVNYHAVTVIGWRDTPSGIQLHYQDSWPNSTGFYRYSKALTPRQLMVRIQTGGFQLYQVQTPSVAGELAVPVNTNFFSPLDQCRTNITFSPWPTIQNVRLHDPVVPRNSETTVSAILDCNATRAIDWEWNIPNSAVRTPTKSACTSSVRFTTNTSGNTITIMVRAKGPLGVWSPWTSATFNVTGTRY